MPDHSWLSRTRARLPHEVHTAIFDWVLALIAEAGLVKGERIGVDASTMGGQRGAAQHRAEGHGRGLPGDAGALGPGERASRHPRPRTWRAWTASARARMLSNQDWVSKSDPEAKIAKMKDGTTHLAYKPEHAVDLDTGAVVAAELHPADEGDTTTLEKTLAAAKENLEAVDAGTDGRQDPAECVTDKGYHSRVGLKGARRRPLEDADLRAQAERFPALAQLTARGPPGSPPTHRTRLLSGVAKEAFKAARRDRRASQLRCPLRQPRSRRHAPDMAARARERAQAIPAPCRRPQSESPDAQTDRRRHPAGGRGGRIWRYLRAYCASWSRSGRSDGPHRLGGWRNRLRRVMFRPSSETRSIAPFSTGC